MAVIEASVDVKRRNWGGAESIRFRVEGRLFKGCSRPCNSFHGVVGSASQLGW